MRDEHRVQTGEKGEVRDNSIEVRYKLCCRKSLLRKGLLHIKLVELITYLLNNLVEGAARVLDLNLLLRSPAWGEVHNIGLVGRTCAASENSNDVTIPGENNRPGVARIEKLSTHLIIDQDSNLDGGLVDAILFIGVGKGLETIDMTNSGLHC